MTGGTFKHCAAFTGSPAGMIFPLALISLLSVRLLRYLQDFTELLASEPPHAPHSY